MADIAHHHWHMEVWTVKKAIDDASINEGRKWANKRCLLIDDTEKELEDDDQLRRATRPRRNTIYKLVIRKKRRIASHPWLGQTERGGYAGNGVPNYHG